MNSPKLQLAHPPIVEAVLDIDCDMRPDFSLKDVETAARDALRDAYPELRFRRVIGQRIELREGSDSTITPMQEELQAFQFVSADKKQLVQLRAQGFSFNRLAPYSSLDDYFPEIERTWQIFVGIVRPLQARVIKLRYINRILLPMPDGNVDLDEYLRLGPRLPDEDSMVLTQFIARNQAVEKTTGSEVSVSLASQPTENGHLPVILDIEAAIALDSDVLDWGTLENISKSLRGLKNRVFENTLTDKCLDLFRQ